MHRAMPDDQYRRRTLPAFFELPAEAFAKHDETSCASTDVTGADVIGADVIDTDVIGTHVAGAAI
jgi:hypothetical protein